MNRYIRTFVVSLIVIFTCVALIIILPKSNKSISPVVETETIELPIPQEEKQPEEIKINKSKPPEAVSISKVDEIEKPGEIIGNSISYENIFNGVNQERYNAKVVILKRSSTLDKVAQDKLNDMLKYKYWAHTNPETQATPWNWFEKEGYDYDFAGENLATDYLTVQDTIKGWMNSETHKRNILRSDYTETGIAISGSLVVQVFGSR